MKLKRSKPVRFKGKKVDKTKAPDMPQFQRKDTHDPVKIRRVSMEEMLKQEINKDDESKGIY